MGKNAKLKQLKKNGATHELFHYREEDYLEIFVDADSSDYRAYLLGSEVTRVKEEEKKTGNYISKIRHVVLGEDYIQWLQKSEQENTYENRVAYAKILSDEEVIALWEDFKDETETRFLPFVAVAEKQDLKEPTGISLEQANEAKSVLAQAFQVKKECVTLHPKFLRQEETRSDYVSPVVKTKTKCLVRFLSLSVQETRNAIQTRKEFEQGRWTERKVPHVSLTAWAENVWSNLPQDAQVVSVPGLLASTQTKDFEEAFQNNLQNLNV